MAPLTEIPPLWGSMLSALTHAGMRGWDTGQRDEVGKVRGRREVGEVVMGCEGSCIIAEG